jgi:hypothetical protein
MPEELGFIKVDERYVRKTPNLLDLFFVISSKEIDSRPSWKHHAKFTFIDLHPQSISTANVL